MTRGWRVAACWWVVAAGAVGCGRDPDPAPPASADPPAVTTPAEAREPGAVGRLEPAEADNRPRIVVLGDSLTAGLGLDRPQAYPSLLQQKLDAAGLPYQVVNAGVSGDTSAGGLSRVDLALEGDVRVFVVALGGNDALRALPPEELQRNLTAIVERARARGIAVMLAGMEAPPNFGADYVAAFRAVYPTIAKKYGVPLLPFLLEGVAGIDRLNQRDGIHPTAEGAQVIADNVWPVLEPLVRADARAGRP